VLGDSSWDVLCLTGAPTGCSGRQNMALARLFRCKNEPCGLSAALSRRLECVAPGCFIQHRCTRLSMGKRADETESPFPLLTEFSNFTSGRWRPALLARSLTVFLPPRRYVQRPNRDRERFALTLTPNQQVQECRESFSSQAPLAG
jgi:hypothetical protein